MQLTTTTERERSWVRQTRRSLAQQAVGYILKWGAYGHLPKHIGASYINPSFFLFYHFEFFRINLYLYLLI